MTIQDEFRAGAEEYARRLTADRERRENPRQAREDAGEAFANFVTQSLDKNTTTTTDIFGYNI